VDSEPEHAGEQFEDRQGLCEAFVAGVGAGADN